MTGLLTGWSLKQISVVIWWNSRSELTQALTSGGLNFTQQEIDALFNAADVDRDGTVSNECPAIQYEFN